MTIFYEILFCCSRSDSDSELRRYDIEVHTGDKKGAGTNADVWIRLHDVRGGRSMWCYLDVDFRDDFQLAGVDNFSFELSSLSRLQKIELWRNNEGWSPDW